MFCLIHIQMCQQQQLFAEHEHILVAQRQKPLISYDGCGEAEPSLRLTPLQEVTEGAEDVDTKQTSGSSSGSRRSATLQENGDSQRA